MASVTLNGWLDFLGDDFCEKHENDFSEYAGFVGFLSCLGGSYAT